LEADKLRRQRSATVDLIRKCREHSGRLLRHNLDYVWAGWERHKQAKLRGTSIIRSDEVLQQADCCFVLSTGRCGTGMLTKILARSKALWPVHEPSPNMIYASSQAYQKRYEDPAALEFGALSARYDLVEGGYARGRIFVDTHPAMSYFSAALARVFRRSKFIHLVRHPGRFARSVLRRKYYTDELVHNGLLAPSLADPVRARWQEMSRIEKVAWLWNELQGFAEYFKSQVEEGRVLTVRSEDLFRNAETTRLVFEFLGVPQPLSDARLANLLRHPVNVQKNGKVRPFEEWSETEKGELRRWATHASTYGYDLR
jgi:hypothetical protein